jgi:hypothetical protein
MDPETRLASSAAEAVEIAGRRVVQITATGHANTFQTQSALTLFALCDDGTIWSLNDCSAEWIRCPAIPLGVTK